MLLLPFHYLFYYSSPIARDIEDEEALTARSAQGTLKIL